MKIPEVECSKISDYKIFHSGYYGGYVVVQPSGYILEHEHWATSGPIVFTSERLAEEYIKELIK